MFKAVMIILLMNAQGDGFEGSYPLRPYNDVKTCLNDKAFLESTVEEGKNVKIVCITTDTGTTI